MELTVGSLFSGIGGLDLGLERAGMRVIWQSEIDPYACRVLKKHWPEVVNHGNIKEINWQEIERPDVICGGYPCQPFSTAGKRRGEEDPRHLWPWVREAISQLRPRYAILENVRGHLSLGGLSVVAELASIGYDAEWRVVSAASVGANHRRDRVVIVAYPQSQYGNGSDNYTGVGSRPETLSELGNGSGAQAMANSNDSGSHRAQVNSAKAGFNALGGLGGCCEDVAHANNTGDGTSGRSADGDGQTLEQGRELVAQFGSCGCCENVADTDNGRCQQREPETQSVQGLSCSCKRDKSVSNNERQRDGQHGITADAGQENLRRIYHGRRKEGYVGWQWWETEPDVGRVAHGVPSRVDRLRGLGNAVVPQVAEVIGRLVISDYQRRED